MLHPSPSAARLPDTRPPLSSPRQQLSQTGCPPLPPDPHYPYNPAVLIDLIYAGRAAHEAGGSPHTRPASPPPVLGTAPLEGPAPPPPRATTNPPTWLQHPFPGILSFRGTPKGTNRETHTVKAPLLLSFFTHRMLKFYLFVKF